MRIAVLASGDGWHVQDLLRAARDLGYELMPISFQRLEGRIATRSNQDRGSSDANATDATTAHTRGAVQGTRRDRRDDGPVEPAESIDLTQADGVLVRTMPAGSLEQVIFRMDVLHRLEAGGVRVLNPPRALESAVDKYLGCCRMEAAGLPMPRTIACENSDAAIEAFDELGGDVVVKPLFGSEGKGITRVTDADVAYRVFRTIERLGGVLYLQEFVPHEGSDLRALVLGESVLATMRRRHDGDWRTNVARGARPEPVELSDEQLDLALRAARAVGAPLAGVDLLPARDGPTYVLEVNAVPGWRAISRVTSIDIASRVLTFLSAEARDASSRGGRPLDSNS